MIITAFLIPDEAELSQLLLHTYIEKRAFQYYGAAVWFTGLDSTWEALFESCRRRRRSAPPPPHCRCRHRESETSSHFLAAICNKKSAIHKFDRVSWHLADINGFSFNMMAHSFAAGAVRRPAPPCHNHFLPFIHSFLDLFFHSEFLYFLGLRLRHRSCC